MKGQEESLLRSAAAADHLMTRAYDCVLLREMSKNSYKSYKRDNTVECPVCSKQFPRGLLDLARHVNAVTLQHLYFDGENEDYPYQCIRCNISFKSDEHLTQHRSQTSCSRDKPFKLKKRADSIDNDNSNVDDVTFPLDSLPVQDYVGAFPQDPSNIDDPNEDPVLNEGKTLECMICGKLFPRGPIDLQRHATGKSYLYTFIVFIFSYLCNTAITLKHLISNKKALGFNFGCNTCGLHFGTAEHLASHKSKSTCNVNMVWPRDAHVTSGLRVIPRSEYNNTVTSPVVEKTKSSPKPVNTRPKKAERNISSASLQSMTSMTGPGESRKRLQEAVQVELSSARQKRTRIIVPEGTALLFYNYKFNVSLQSYNTVERQAYFGVVSLLIDPSKLDSGVQITDDNYEEFIPEEHRPLIERLKKQVLDLASSTCIGDFLSFFMFSALLYT